MNTAFCTERFGGTEWFMSGFWPMKEEKALNINFIVHHDNNIIVEVLKVQERMKVLMVEKNGEPFAEGQLERWAFKGRRATNGELAAVRREFADKKLKGLQRPSYENIEFIESLPVRDLKGAGAI